jgi:3-isopropylmalate/(R)-2-methylmalate dehydratase small subunit
MAAGLRRVIAESIGDIFYNNCFQNGMLPLVLPETTVRDLAAQAADGASLTVNIVDCSIVTPKGEVIRFDMDSSRRDALIEGVDDISRTLKEKSGIAAWQARDHAARPWIWDLPAA